MVLVECLIVVSWCIYDRGSLFRLIHKPASGEILDPRRRLRMALDVVCACQILLFFFDQLDIIYYDV